MYSCGIRKGCSPQTTIWNVRNFHSNLEHIAEEGSRFSLGYLALDFFG
jgi:hypothetical protein